ncbi:MAG TPA: hypothetical protein VFR76_05335, partial [Verrucomicrobiae bacterium]|nr:hypothetical protein [Verrucomicrobiae bacterium]
TNARSNGQRSQPSARDQRDFVPQFASQCGDDVESSGVSDFMAREIVGHESAAVSRQYTHLTTDDKRAAMRRLPDVTNS